MAKSIFKSKTILAALATVVVGVVDQAVAIVPDQWSGAAIAAAGLIFALLRKVTGVPLK